MNILITGATSGLGRSACDMALALGFKVIAVGRNQAVLDTLNALGCQTYACDLAKQALPNHLVATADTIWHCAALSSPWGAYDEFYAVNVKATQTLATQAGIAGVPSFVHISTPSLYFDYHHHIDIQETYRPSRYVNHYAHTKAQGENAIVQLTQQFPKTRYVMLRPRAIFGQYDQVLIPRLLKVIKQKGFLPLPSGGQAMMDFTFADNVVEAMLCASRADLPNDVSGQAFNITNGEPMALRAVLDKLFVDELQMDFKIKAVPYPILHSVAVGLESLSKLTKKEPILTAYSVGALNFDMVLNIDKAREVLGYVPKVSMSEGIERTALSLI
ncbi:NAD(P)-dependent oxidoreductase [Moraxella sp. ZY210820]|uniref:NAD-dependent epimerase/dehydratase family protein n=1 Tax=unclassified Moraxella TaxID=2685852 RepID=UPI002730899D|nr:SDR family NAD(P)-dependent oxidoreductase [Moraxella sp. ZY210820]WLF84559.1 SDR family NAD(P)-dependent oxidoreductase [Moraxella sp. ZY210820]